MKKLNLLKTMLLLCALIVGSVNSVWADEVTYTFTSKSWEATLDGESANWTSGKDGNGYATDQGIQVTTGTTGANATSPVSYPNISKVVVTYNTNKSKGEGSISIKIGDNGASTNNVAYSSGDDGTQAHYTTTFDYATPQTGYVTITVNTTTNSIYPKSITITYEDTSDTRIAVNMTDFTAASYSIVVGETTETTVTNDQASWTAAYTYESSDENVAKVSETGVITAKAKGTATITATLKFDAGDTSYKAGSDKSMSIKITVTNPFHNVTFYRNGAVYETTPVEEGEDVTFPDDPSALGGKSFVGWAEDPIDGTADEEPEFVTTATMSISDLKYYAVYALVSGDLTVTTDELTRATTEVTGTSYTGWSGKTASSSAVYAGNSAGGNESIQLRSKESNSGIVTTTSGGKVKKIVVEWNSNTSNDRTIDIYGKNGAYSAASDLYGNNSGTKLGSIANGSTELTIDDDYEYIGIRSNNGALYLDKIFITWESGSATYSDYCTTVKETATVGDAGYATYVTKSDVEFAANDAYAVTIVDGKAVLNAVTKVPAGTAVLLEGTGEKAASVLNETPADVTNELNASDGTITGDNATIYVLANINNKVGFYLLDSNVTIPAGKAYLQTANGDARQFIGLDDESTGISATLVSGEKANNDVYDLSGRKIVNGKSVNGKLQRGLYIVNGKKVVVR